MDIKGRMLFATNVEILNLSLGGASISLNKKLNMGSTYTLKLECRDKALSLTGEVVWEKISGSRKTPKGEVVPIYTAGLNFKEVMTGKASEVMDFIMEHTHDRKVRLIGVRVKIRELEKASIDYPHHFTVLKISLGGMLVETEQEMHVKDKYPMELSFDEEEPPVAFTGRVASCLRMPEPEKEIYHIGIEFLLMSDDEKLKLKDFIRILQELEKK